MLSFFRLSRLFFRRLANSVIEMKIQFLYYSACYARYPSPSLLGQNYFSSASLPVRVYQLDKEKIKKKKIKKENV